MSSLKCALRGARLHIPALTSARSSLHTLPWSRLSARATCFQKFRGSDRKPGQPRGLALYSQRRSAIPPVTRASGFSHLTSSWTASLTSLATHVHCILSFVENFPRPPATPTLDTALSDFRAPQDRETSCPRKASSSQGAEAFSSSMMCFSRVTFHLKANICL